MPWNLIFYSPCIVFALDTANRWYWRFSHGANFAKTAFIVWLEFFIDAPVSGYFIWMWFAQIMSSWCYGGPSHTCPEVLLPWCCLPSSQPSLSFSFFDSLKSSTSYDPSSLSSSSRSKSSMSSMSLLVSAELSRCLLLRLGLLLRLERWSEEGGGGGGMGEGATSRIEEAGAHESETLWPANGRVHEVYDEEKVVTEEEGSAKESGSCGKEWFSDSWLPKMSAGTSSYVGVGSLSWRLIPSLAVESLTRLLYCSSRAPSSPSTWLCTRINSGLVTFLLGWCSPSEPDMGSAGDSRRLAEAFLEARGCFGGGMEAWQGHSICRCILHRRPLLAHWTLLLTCRGGCSQISFHPVIQHNRQDLIYFPFDWEKKISKSKILSMSHPYWIHTIINYFFHFQNKSGKGC